MGIELDNLDQRVGTAVGHYWSTLQRQAAKQQSGDSDRGGRAGATGGKQMDGFSQLVKTILVENGMPRAHVFSDQMLELPGYFRPSKKWDLVVVYKGQLVAALEFKSHAGKSISNNFNNRSEESIGTAHDLWTALREGAFGFAARPFVGTVVLLEDNSESRKAPRVVEPHFPVFPEFYGASYGKRYELLLRRLARERLYDSAALVLATAEGGARGEYSEPAPDLTMRNLLAGLVGHTAGFIAGAQP